MEQMKKNCTGMESKLADLLLDPSSAPAKVQAHVAECEGCRAELAELKATMDLLDGWEAPEPSPYFLTRLNARMREEREAAPRGWLSSRIARLRAGFAYGPVSHARPLAAMALTVLLLVGGGAYLGVTDWTHANQPPAQTAVVHDLQLLDSNAQLLDQMESLTGDQNGD
jgi:anti-sigma factor RsiW